jgi:hypothetical protein
VQTKQTFKVQLSGAGLRAMAGEKIKLKEEAIREILVTDTAWELGVEASGFKD